MSVKTSQLYAQIPAALKPLMKFGILHPNYLGFAILLVLLAVLKAHKYMQNSGTFSQHVRGHRYEWLEIV